MEFDDENLEEEFPRKIYSNPRKNNSAKRSTEQSIDKNMILKEIFIRRQPEDWNEITINTGGISSTLQDIKAQQRSGSYAYKNVANRFISWRSERNLLEVMEHSLDLNLHGNQVRFIFTDSPVLEGVSITEAVDSVVLLVPTVSSVHRFTFPLPDKMNTKNYGEPAALSIFHGVNEADTTDPRTYCVLNTPPCALICAASCIAPNDNAIFALSLANSSIIVVEMEWPSGKSNVITFTQDSLVPRFFTRLTDAILKKESSENVSVSLLLHYINQELFLFSLDRQGLLKAFSCERGAAVSSVHLINKNVLSMIKNQKHKMFKGVIDGKLVIHCCIQGLYIFSVSPVPKNGVFTFSIECETKTPSNFELVNVCSTEGDDIWCNWLSDLETPAVTRINLTKKEWANVHLSRPPAEVRPSKTIVCDQATLHLDAIFASGFFTSHDITKALSIYKSTAVIKPNVDIREQICAVVEAEIYSEVGEQDLYDDEFQDLNQRCWRRLYSCCTQFITSALLPLSLQWVGDSLIIIQECGFSLVRPMEMLELFWKGNAFADQYPDVMYGTLLEKLRVPDLDGAMDMIDVGLYFGHSIESAVESGLAIVPQYSDELQDVRRIEQALDILRLENTEDALLGLCSELAVSTEFVREDEDWKSFCSNNGISAVVSGLKDFCSVRYTICKKLLLILGLWEGRGQEAVVKPAFTQTLRNYCQQYHALLWACSTNIHVDVPIVLSYASAHYGTMMAVELEDSVLALIRSLWPDEDNKALPQHLLDSKQYVMVERYSQLVNYDKWRLLLTESYLGMGEFDKAFDVCMKTTHMPISYYLKCIKMFEVNQRSDFAIGIASRTLNESLEISQSDLDTLQSVLFLHELQLKHFSAAYGWMDACTDTGRKTAFLQRLVSSMIQAGHFEELINFPFIGIGKELDILLTNRARRSPLAQALQYYNLLYAFHVKNLNHKSAATVMFEKGLRSDTCEMQWRCFGACLNSLMLLSKEDAWILRPNVEDLEDETAVEILTAEDIRKVFELAGVKYNLGHCPKEASEEEIIALCVKSHHYRIALRVSKICKKPYAPIIQSFTAQCANIEISNEWHWLKLNDLDDMIVNENNYQEICWKMLERYIERYEKPNETELYRAATNQFLEMGRRPPNWLTKAYKKRNCSELLRLFFNHGYLEESSELACDYLKAAMGVNWKEYSISAPLLPTSPPLCLPINIIDLLIAELKYHSVTSDLENVLKQYVDLAMRITQDKLTVF